MLTTKSASHAPTPEQQQQLVARILASQLFRKSHKLAAFLKFICDRQRLGLAESINEQRIGTEVFGRSEGYHMGEDSIVRSQARFLRMRLQEYFESEGRSEPITLTIPKGSYVPEFHFREAAAEPVPVHTPVASPVPYAPPAKHDTPRPAGRQRWLPVAAAAAVALIALSLWYARILSSAGSASTNESRFWATIFDAQRPTLIVPADSGLVLMEEMTGSPVTPADYMSHRYLDAPAPAGMAAAWNAIRSSQYTNMADLNLVSHLDRISKPNGARVRIRFARDLTLKELKESNPVLIGGTRSDPWVGVFDSSAGLSVDYDWQTHVNFVRNRQPGQGEQSRYDEIGQGGQHIAYGVIEYLSGLDGEGSALLVGGTSKAGTEAAAEFLFNPGFADFLKRMDKGGKLSHFEILLSTQNLNGDSYQSTIVCSHRLSGGNPVSGSK